MKISYVITAILLGLSIPLITIQFFAKDEQQPKTDTSKTDSMKVFYSKQLDSIKVENQLLQVKIEAKTETIKTLKGLVKENNEKINPNNSVPILDSLRRSGFGKD